MDIRVHGVELPLLIIGLLAKRVNQIVIVAMMVGVEKVRRRKGRGKAKENNKTK